MAKNSAIDRDADYLVGQNGSELYAADAGSTDTYAITLTPAPTALTTGMEIRFKANTANIGAASLDVCSLGAVAIKKNKDVDLADNDIKAGQIIIVEYDGTNFQMQTPSSNLVPATTSLPSFLSMFLAPTNSAVKAVQYTDDTKYLLAIEQNDVYSSIRLYNGFFQQSQYRYNSGHYQMCNFKIISGLTTWTNYYGGAMVKGGYIYIKLRDTNAATNKIFRCAVTDDISVNTSWVDLTISGTALINASYLIGYGNSNFWIADYTTGAFIPYTLSGTTLTSGTNVNVTNSYYNSACRVNEKGIWSNNSTGTPTMPLCNFSGTPIADRGIAYTTIQGGSNAFSPEILAFPNNEYILAINETYSSHEDVVSGYQLCDM